MKITRTINGKEMEIELTDDELYRAYTEQQNIYDRMDVEDVICGWSDKEVKDIYGISKQAFMSMVGDMASELRRNIDHYDLSWEYARDQAIHDVIETMADDASAFV